MESDWWKTFFAGIWLDVQRNMRAERTKDEVEFLQRALNVVPPSRILDVPCGNGRLALPLAERGFRVTGVDITTALVNEAQLGAQSADLDIELLEMDMREILWDETFDGAFCFWGSFGYFDDDGNRNFVEAVHRALRSGARFVLDIPNIAETILPRFRQRDWSKIDKTVVLEDKTYRHADSRFDIEWTLIANGVSETKTTSMRVYGFRELVTLFSEIGFELSDAFCSLDFEPYELGRRGYFVFSKS